MNYHDELLIYHLFARLLHECDAACESVHAKRRMIDAIHLLTAYDHVVEEHAIHESSPLLLTLANVLMKRAPYDMKGALAHPSTCLTRSLP